MKITRRNFGIGTAALLAALSLRPKAAHAGTITKSIGTASRDYSTIALWVASLPANLVTDGNSYVGQIYNDSGELTTTTVTLAGHTTDATHTITLTTGPGQSFRDNAGVRSNALKYNASNGVAINATTAYSAVVICADHFVTISNLQLKAATTNTVFAVASNAGFDGELLDVTISDCIIDNNWNCVSLGAGTSILNSLIVMSGGSNFVGARYSAGLIEFCTIVAPSDGTSTGRSVSPNYASGAVVKNCAMFGFSAALSTSGTTYTTCMTDITSPPTGVTGSKTYANQFTGTTVAGEDFRVKAGADLIGAATADSTNGATDISNLARPQAGSWDIGAWEVAAAASAIPLPPFPSPMTTL